MCRAFGDLKFIEADFVPDLLRSGTSTFTDGDI
jgi:hypothetical protein